MVHLLIFKPIGRFAKDVARPVIAKQPWLVQRRCLITPRSLRREVERAGHTLGLHHRAELPCFDVLAVVVEDRR